MFHALSFMVAVLAFLTFGADRLHAQTTPRPIMACIYYSNPNTDPDRAFERAARRYLVGNTFYPTEVVGVRTKQDFINAWNGILKKANSNKTKVFTVAIFCHASKGDVDMAGLEFADGTGGGRLRKEDIQALPVLPWNADSSIHIRACNAGLIGTRGWCPAQVFAQHQKITTFGEAGYAYFSKDPVYFQRLSKTDTDVYLRAFNQRRNNPIGDEKMMPPKTYDSNGRLMR